VVSLEVEWFVDRQDFLVGSGGEIQGGVGCCCVDLFLEREGLCVLGW